MGKNLRYNFFILFVFSSCQTFQRSTTPKTHVPQIVTSQPTAPTQTVPPTASNESTIVTPQIVTPQISQTPGASGKNVPKFGVIFSAGGAKTWAHISILKEMQKYKFPVASVAGIEWGAVIAAAYAQNASVNEVEWELSKFKDIDDWQNFIKAAFAKKSTLDFKIPFVCPSVNLKNKTSYLLNRGQVDQFLPYCVPSAGVIKPYGNSVANLSELNLLVQHLKATGVNKIILINVLSTKSDIALMKGLDSTENQIWTQFVASLAKKIPGIDEVIDIEMNDYKIEDFDKRRDIMVKASEIGYGLVKKLADKYKL